MPNVLHKNWEGTVEIYLPRTERERSFFVGFDLNIYKKEGSSSLFVDMQVGNETPLPYLIKIRDDYMYFVSSDGKSRNRALSFAFTRLSNKNNQYIFEVCVDGCWLFVTRRGNESLEKLKQHYMRALSDTRRT